MLSTSNPGIRMDHMILHLLTDLVLVIENVAGPLVHALENEHLIERRTGLHDLLDELDIGRALVLHCSSIMDELCRTGKLFLTIVRTHHKYANEQCGVRSTYDLRIEVCSGSSRSHQQSSSK